MSETGEGYRPGEADKQSAEHEKAPLSEKGIGTIQGKRPEAGGAPLQWTDHTGNLITPEKEEIYRSPETMPEKEPGLGPKPSWSDDPNKNSASSASDAACARTQDKLED